MTIVLKKVFLLVYILLFFALIGCTPISKNKAENLIIKKYSNNLGKATIVAAEEKNSAFIIKWKTK